MFSLEATGALQPEPQTLEQFVGVNYQAAARQAAAAPEGDAGSSEPFKSFVALH